jgi:hypothetical protein
MFVSGRGWLLPLLQPPVTIAFGRTPRLNEGVLALQSKPFVERFSECIPRHRAGM